MDMYINFLALAVSLLALVVASVTLYITHRIPHQIMINQTCTDFLQKYGSTEMGIAIRAIFDFFKNNCDSELGEIEGKYHEKLKQDSSCNSVEFKDTLHFQRRLVDQYFWLLADIRYNKNYAVTLSKKRLREYFTKKERNLLSILYYMNAADREYQKEMNINDINIPKDKMDDIFGGSIMDKHRRKLYEESEDWKNYKG